MRGDSPSLRRWRELGIFALFSALLFIAAASRRPDAVLRAQFWAEDGTIFFADNYNLGVLHSLAQPYGGYFNTFPRIATAVALLFPLALAPLVTNLLALCVQALPAIFLLTPRFAHMASLKARGLMAALLIGVPVSYEVQACVSHSQRFLALALLLVLVAKPPTTWAWRAFDLGVVLVGGLTGPSCVFLLPLGFVIFRMRRESWMRVLLAVLAGVAAVQVVAFAMTAPEVRSTAPLGATPMLLVDLVGGRVIVDALVGPSFLPNHPAIAGWISLFGFEGALALAAYGLYRAPVELRLFLVFGVAILAAALRFPHVTATLPQWPVMDVNQNGGRYWLTPVIAFLFVYVWMMGRERPALVRLIGSLAVAAALWTDVLYWRYPAYPDNDFQKYAREFQGVPAGQQFTFPINPSGWTVTLHKH